MADNMDFDSAFENLDDLDWSELEKDIKESASDAAEGAAAAGGAQSKGAPAGADNTATISAGGKAIDINYLLDVDLMVTVEVGRRLYFINEVLTWNTNSIIEMGKLVGEPLNLLVNGKQVAKGEVVVVNDKFALKIIEILDPHDRLTYLQG